MLHDVGGQRREPLAFTQVSDTKTSQGRTKTLDDNLIQKIQTIEP